MGSATQIGLGVIILGAAFVFGHYVHKNALQETPETEIPIGDVEWQSAALRDRLKSSQSIAPPAQQNDVPQSSMPIAGLNNSPVVRKNGDSDFSPADLPSATQDTLAPPPIVAGELPPLRSDASITADTKSPPKQAEPILQPDFSKLLAMEEAKQEPGASDKQTALKLAPLVADKDNQQPHIRSDSQPSFQGDWGRAANLEPSPPITEAKRLDRRLSQKSVNELPNSSTTDPSKKKRVVDSQFVSNSRPQLRPIQQPRRMNLDTAKYLTYVTRRNDTLQKISTRYFGSADYYLDIYIANRGKLKNPTDVPANIELRIPVYEE